jgi:hypothetical protein
MPTKKIELEACPFCGAPPTEPQKITEDRQRPVWEIQCSLFCVRRGSPTKKRVIAEWNTRKGPISQGKQLKLDLEIALNDTRMETLNKTTPGRDLGLRIEKLLDALVHQAPPHSFTAICSQISLDDFWGQLSSYLYGLGDAYFIVEYEE